MDIRSIGNAMLHMVDNLWRPITVDTFLQCMNSDDPQQRWEHLCTCECVEFVRDCGVKPQLPQAALG